MQGDQTLKSINCLPARALSHSYAHLLTLLCRLCLPRLKAHFPVHWSATDHWTAVNDGQIDRTGQAGSNCQLSCLNVWCSSVCWHNCLCVKLCMCVCVLPSLADVFALFASSSSSFSSLIIAVFSLFLISLLKLALSWTHSSLPFSNVHRWHDIQWAGTQLIPQFKVHTAKGKGRKKEKLQLKKRTRKGERASKNHISQCNHA